MNGLKNFRTENGSSPDQNLALTILSVSNSLHSGMMKCRPRWCPCTAFCLSCTMPRCVSLQREFFTDKLLVRTHLIINMILLDWLCAMRVCGPESGPDCLICAEFWVQDICQIYPARTYVCGICPRRQGDLFGRRSRWAGVRIAVQINQQSAVRTVD